MNRNAILGKEGEDSVSRRLREEGYRVLDRNWRRPWGELDIVAERSGVITFIEVKAAARRNAGFSPLLRANHAKMGKVLRTARTWLAAHHFGDSCEWQVLVASVIMTADGPDIELIPLT